MVIHPLEDACKRRLATGQVITSLIDAVKELLENALDASASSISITLHKDGWDKIIVKDNGSGVPIDGRQGMALRYHTSKMSAFDDLESIETLGFRGEALNSICAISKRVLVTTKTAAEPTATVFDFDASGNVVSSNPSSAQTGTTVEIRNIFYNTPVRRQHGQKMTKTNARRIKEMLIRYAIVRSDVRFAMTTKNGSSESTTTFSSSKSTHSAVTSTLGTDLSAACMPFAANIFDLVLPRSEVDSVVFKHSPVVSINKRPVANTGEEIKTLLKILKEEYGAVSRSEVSRAPFAVVNISLPTNTYDVNVEPSKNRVLFHDLQGLQDGFAKVLREAWAEARKRETAVASPSSIYTRDSGSPFVRNMFDSIGEEDLGDDCIPISKEVPTAVSEDEDEIEIVGDDISSTANPWTLAKLVMSSVPSTTIVQPTQQDLPSSQNQDSRGQPSCSSKQTFLSFNNATPRRSSPAPRVVPEPKTSAKTSSTPIKTNGIMTYLSTHDANNVRTPPTTPKRRYLLSAPYRTPKKSAIDTLHCSITVSTFIKPRTLSFISSDPICEPRPYTCKFPPSTPAWTLKLSDIDIQRIDNNIIARMDSKTISICTFNPSQTI